MSVRPLHDSTNLIVQPERLHQQLQDDGYVFLRGVIPRQDIKRVLDEITEPIRAAGWLESLSPDDLTANRAAACVEPQPSFREVYDQVYFKEAFHALPHHSALKRTISSALQTEMLLVHPRPIGRLIFPIDTERGNFSTPAHQDYWALQGSPETVTVWIPLHDCAFENGSLMVAERTHRDGIFDYRLALGAGGVEVSDPLNDRWRGGDFEAGDIIIFYTLTVHKAAPNISNEMRLSLDCRYQSAADPVSELAFELKGEGYDWNDLYVGWERNDLKYYWSKFDLRKVPYDPKYYAKRDELALEEGAKGNIAAISTLQRLARFSTDAERRESAARILANLGSI